MTTLWQDLVYGLRMLARKPALTAVAALSIALAIAANTTIFSLIDATLLGDIPYRDPGRVGVVWGMRNRHPDDRYAFTVADLRLLASQAHSIESIGATYQNTKSLSATSAGAGENGQPAERLAVQQFTANMFDVLGVKPALGRAFTADEDHDLAPAPVAVLSDRFWQRHFNSDRGVIGRKITVDGEADTVIGVMPPSFDFLAGDTDIFTPAGFTSAQIASTARFVLTAVRLRPGVSWASAQTEIAQLGQRYAAAYPDRDKDMELRIETVREAMNGDIEKPLLVLEGAVLFVLLIACANVANLLLARASTRETEIAIRSALGAGRGRVIRQLLTESVLLAVLGGIGGLVIGWAALRLFVASVPENFDGLNHASVDLRVLLFAAAVSILTGLLFGLAPALQSSRGELTSALKETGRGGSAGGAKLRFRGALVVAQIGLSLILLIGAGLMINSFLRLVNNRTGLDPARVLTFNFRIPQAQLMKQVGRYRGVGLWQIFPTVEPTYDRILERLRALPGVQSAAVADAPPLRGYGMGMSFLVEGKPRPATEAERQSQFTRYMAISPDYFSTLKIPFARGRDFTDRDTEASPLVLIVNQTFARRFLGNEDAIGKRITLDLVPNEQPREIVGVVADSRASPYERVIAPVVYLPHVQQAAQWQGPSWNARASMFFLMKTSGDPLALSQAVRRAVAEIDPDKPVSGIQTVEQSVRDNLLGDRLYMLLLGSFGLIAAMLAAVGIYGVMSYTVAQRSHEIGIRMALGAGQWEVLRLVTRQSLLLIFGGLLLGLAGSFALTRFLANDLFEVAPTDPLTFGAVSGLLLVVALLATVIPTRRATHVDPTIALRCQ